MSLINSQLFEMNNLLLIISKLAIKHKILYQFFKILYSNTNHGEK